MGKGISWLVCTGEGKAYVYGINWLVCRGKSKAYV